MPILALLIFILILSILVMIHELGHFLVAKKSGITVEEFGYGIPPKIFGKKIGGTIYSINLFPFGGFVRVQGEDFSDPGQKTAGNFAFKPPYIRMLVLIAGIFMNVVFGSLLFFVVLASRNFVSAPLMTMGDENYHFPFGKQTKIETVITFVAEGSPAKTAGFDFGDYITGAGLINSNEARITSVSDLQTYVGSKGGQNIIFEVKNMQTDKIQQITATPKYDDALQRSAIGVGLGSAFTLSYTAPLEKPVSGLLHGVNVTLYSMNILGQLINTSVSKKSLGPVSEGFSGPVGIFGVVAGVINAGGDSVVLTLMDITALLSFSLAFFNILPLPALDGGRVVFVLYEIVFKKRPNPRLESLSHSFGLAVLLLLMFLVTFKDIFKPF